MRGADCWLPKRGTWRADLIVRWTASAIWSFPGERRYPSQAVWALFLRLIHERMVSSQKPLAGLTVKLLPRRLILWR
jgi:hypothetical protein